MSAPLLPQTSGRPVFGHFPDLIRTGMFPLLRDHWVRHGDAFKIKVGGKHMAAFIHPDAVETILVSKRQHFFKGGSYDEIRHLVGDGVLTVEGDKWKQQRRTIQPCMNRSFLKGFAEPMVQASVDLVDEWAEAGESSMDIYPQMLHLALRILGQTLFGIDLRDSADVSTRAFTVTLETVSQRGNTIYAPPLSWPTRANRRFRKALGELDEIVYAMIRGRAEAMERGEACPTDLISMLLEARDENGEPMDHRLARDEIITMFLAGHETTALALTWTWYLLAMHPEVEQRLHEELEQVLGGREPTFDDLPALKYTKCILQESMRVCPPVWSGARDVVEDTDIQGYAVRKGELAIYVPYLTHRHPEFWSRPEAFMPERFEPDQAKGRHKFAYLPFSAGPRACVGNHFTMIEAQLAIAVIAQRYRFDLRPGHVVEPEYQITTRPRFGMQMLVHRRDQGAQVFDPRTAQAAAADHATQPASP